LLFTLVRLDRCTLLGFGLKVDHIISAPGVIVEFAFVGFELCGLMRSGVFG
jgi:hypothetical protein